MTTRSKGLGLMTGGGGGLEEAEEVHSQLHVILQEAKIADLT